MRPIDADALLELIENDAPVVSFHSLITKSWVIAALKSEHNLTPTIDAVPVVRCKDCRWWKNVQCSAITSDLPLSTDPNWFCADGEKVGE